MQENVRNAMSNQKSSSSPHSSPLAPLQHYRYPFQNHFAKKNQYRQQGHEHYVRPSYSAGRSSAIYRTNEADLDMDIAYLSHAKVSPFNIGDSERFRKVITLAIIVGHNYCLPNFNMIGGELLDINWDIYKTKPPCI